jgi:hypothetical protein
MSKDTKAQKRRAKQRAWEDLVAEGIKEGTVIKSEPTDPRDRDAGKSKEHPDGNTVEMIVENFHGIKRATGIGPTPAKAREALVAELVRFTGNAGPAPVEEDDADDESSLAEKPE